MFRPTLDLLAEDIDLYDKHSGEQSQEDKEGYGNASALNIRNGGPGGQHVLYSPWLASKLCHDPSAFRGNVSQGNEKNCKAMKPGELFEVLAAIAEMERKEEEKDEKTSHAYHDAETPEIEGYEGHNVVGRLYETIAVVRHCRLQVFFKGGNLVCVLVLAGRTFHQFPIFLKRCHGLLAELHFFFHAQYFLTGI